MERDNRKSHLAPQLSPSTQDLLRSTDSPTYQVAPDDRALHTPTSGEIPIGGAGIISPRDLSNRSPTRNGHGGISVGGMGGIGVVGRGAGSSHPGLGQRIITTNSIPKIGHHPESAGPQSASAMSFSLPVRPGPPGGPLPPPPPRKETPDELRRENRRQATFGMPSNGAYGIGYPPAN